MRLNKVKVVGCGPGYKKLMTFEAVEAIKSSDLIFGAERLLDNFPNFKGEKVKIKGNYSSILKRIKNEYRIKKIAVLVSGDVCFFSFSRLVLNEVGRDNCEFYPGISSVQYAFSKLRLEWNDVLFLSFHGRDKNKKENCNIERIIRDNPKIAILTDGDNGVKNLFNVLRKNLFNDKKIFIMENLSYPDRERIKSVSYEKALNGNFSPLNVVVILNKELI